MYHGNLRLVWENPKSPSKSVGWMDVLDFWIMGMNSYLQYIDSLAGLWTRPDLIQGSRWVKKVCLDDRSKVVFVVLDYDGIELASIPVNFSVSVSSHSIPRLTSLGS